MKSIEKVAILSISILTIIATSAIGPALGSIHNAFPSASPLLIKLIVTLPALICIPVSLSTSKITKHISKKTTIMSGIILYIIGGILGAFATNIYFLLTARGILGLGLGIVAPLSLVIIGDFFDGKERAKFMGYSAAISNLGAVIAIILVGFLAAFSWEDVFYVYLIGIIVLIIVAIFLPNHSTIKHEESTDTSHIKLNKSVFKYALIVMLAFITFYSIPTNIALLLSSKNIGNPETSGYIISILTLFAFLSGMFFEKLLKAFKSYISVFSFILMTIGLVLLAMSTSLVLMYFSVILIGFGFGCVVPNGMFQASKCVHKKHTALAISIIATSIYIGEFISPIILDYIAKALRLNNLIGSFYGAAILAFLSILISLYSALSSRKKA